MRARDALAIFIYSTALGLWIAGLLAAAIWFFAFLSVGAVLFSLGVFLAGWAWFFAGLMVIVVTDK